jgi:hypothetical protein
MFLSLIVTTKQKPIIDMVKKKGKPKANIPYEHRSKNPQQNNS